MKQRFALVSWALFVVAGVASMTAYSMTAARTDPRIVSTWPALVTRSSLKNTLVVFLNPKCGCSRATLAELETLVPALGSNVQTVVYFYYPSKEGEDFARGKLFELAARTPQLHIAFDEDGHYADLFHARASGETMYYAVDGSLKFHGGLTPLRGHGGDNTGRRAVLALSRNEKPESSTSKVFGCQLKEDLRSGVALVQ